MNEQQWLSVLGAAAGSFGSVITAFSLNSVIRELNIARKGIETTVEMLAGNEPRIPVFKGFDQRFDRSVRWGHWLVGVGVLLLVAGFVLQATSTIIGP